MLELGHRVTYVGVGLPGHPAYDGRAAVDEIAARLPQAVDLYLWVDPGGRYFPPGIEALPLPTACYLVDVHLGHWRQAAARFFDSVFVAQRDYVPVYRAALGHAHVHWLPLAAAPDVHRRHPLPRDLEVAFVGNLALAHRGTARARRLRLITGRYRTNDVKRQYTPDEVGRVYSQARIVFNTSLAGDVNMRVFEATACGALLVTDRVANGLETLFELEREIVTYRSDAELVERIDYFLAHPAEREAVAEAGYRRTAGEHTYLQRAEALMAHATALEAGRAAPMRAASPAEQRAARRRVYTHLHMLDAILDEARRAGHGPLRRAWAALPCLLRRLAR